MFQSYKHVLKKENCEVFFIL